MLQIQDIRKKYVTGDLVQTALDGVSLNLRDNEFVAILGPSGSGKTTLLNVIGGLDRYDSGDLVINGISTKKYTDRDWDSYRNHTIGFVFQSYNLIPHQTVLANVELALTISGVSRAQRRKRAIQALEDVGLGDQLHKKPNQMSGGQMQRVAIARALVNNPSILLADEPTGALDSETSVQIMELLKEVAKDRLVVMVTHNPELAEAYANRIVRVRDGRIIDDTNPLQLSAAQEPPKHKNMGKASMSVWTALSLSFNNLRTKKARTLLTAFAGSIGIIGIALILSLSTGFQRYIDQIQEDTLASYPLTIQSETANMGAAMLAMGTSMSEAQNVQGDLVLEQQMIAQMFAQVGSNDLRSFKAYLEENYPQVAPYITTIQYKYGIKPLIYSADGTTQVNPGKLFEKITGNAMMSAYMDSDVFQELLDDRGMLESQYEVLRGRLPESWNELLVILPDRHMMTDYMAYTLGIRDMAVLEQMMQQVMNGEEPTLTEEPMQWTYDELMALRFRLLPASAKYRYNSEYGVWEDMSADAEFMSQIMANGEELTVVGVVCPAEGSSGMVTGGIGYTADLTRWVISTAAQTPIVQGQLADTTLDVFTGKPFGSQEESQMDFDNLITVDGDMLSSAFGIKIREKDIQKLLDEAMDDISQAMTEEMAPAQQAFQEVLAALAKDMLQGYIAASGDPATVSMGNAQQIVNDYLATDAASALIAPLTQKYSMEEAAYVQVYKPLLAGMITTYVAKNVQIQPDTEGEGGTAVDPYSLSASISSQQVESIVAEYASSALVTGASGVVAGKMVEGITQQKITSVLAGFDDKLMRVFGKGIYVDEQKIANAFRFNLTEEELRRLMEAMAAPSEEASAASNLRNLGYAELAEPTSMSVYLKDFAGKESFMAFLDDYNARMEAAGQEEQVISYTDVTGVMMSSVRVIIDSVSYVLIAFVAVSLVVSSIMIGIITYISVMERTKEIGVLRAIGASKRNISQVFNAETFIIGLISGAIGIGITLLLIVPINQIIHHLTANTQINAQLPMTGAVILVILSVVLTLIGGLIPSKKAAKKDPVIALRSE